MIQKNGIKNLIVSSRYLSLLSLKNLSFILLFVFLNNLIFATSARSQWELRDNNVLTLSGVKAMAFGKNTYLGLEYTTTFTSFHGVNWSRYNNDLTFYPNDVTYGKDTYVAVGDSGEIGISQNGINWVTRTSPTSDTSAFNTVFYGGGLFLAGFNTFASNTGPVIYISEDVGLNWSTAAIPNNLPGGQASTTYIDDFAYGNGVFVAVGSHNSGATAALFYSLDGKNWNEINPGLWENTYAFLTLDSVAYGNGMFVAVGGDLFSNFPHETVILTSADGITWIRQTSGAAVTTGTNLLHVVYNKSYIDSKFYATDGDELMLTSNDGVNWTQETMGSWKVQTMVSGNNGVLLGTTSGIVGRPLDNFSTHIKQTITANGSSGTVTISSTETLSIKIGIDAGDFTMDADWWVVASTPNGWYYWGWGGPWVFSGAGFNVSILSPLSSITPFEILNICCLGTGTYTLYFGVDLNQNALLDTASGVLFYDSVIVNVQ